VWMSSFVWLTSLERMPSFMRTSSFEGTLSFVWGQVRVNVKFYEDAKIVWM